MSIKEVTFGSVGPFMYDDASFEAVNTDGTCKASGTPTDPDHLVRLQDLASMGLQSMTYEEDGFYQAAAPAAHATIYTVTDYSGSGRLASIGFFTGGTVSDGYLIITADGNAHTWDMDSVNAACGTAFTSITGGYGMIPLSLEFTASLKVEFANDNALNTRNIACQTQYGILSKEIRREIIPAGKSLPDRDYVYPFDVMAIWFLTEKTGKVSNKIQFPQSLRERLSIDSQGSISGVLEEASFNIVLGAPRYEWKRCERDEERVLSLNGEQYLVSFKKGILIADKLPKILTKVPIDAR